MTYLILYLIGIPVSYRVFKWRLTKDGYAWLGEDVLYGLAMSLCWPATQVLFWFLWWTVRGEES